LGHPNYEAIVKMVQSQAAKGMLIDLFHIPPKYQFCISRKQTKTLISKRHEKGHKAIWPLEIIWVDLSGPHAVTLRTGNNYVIDIVDDHTSCAWSIPLKRKDD
ncbi:hypothetical protein ARMGADRAFT_875242, partial [Armillaria gallica]